MKYAIVDINLGRPGGPFGLIRGVHDNLDTAIARAEQLRNTSVLLNMDVKLYIYRLVNPALTAGDWVQTGDVEVR